MVPYLLYCWYCKISFAEERKNLENLEEMYGVSGDRLNCEIQEKDMIFLASYFDNVDYYLSALDLTPAEQTDVTRISHRDGTQIAMNHCLLLWRKHDPSTATLRTILEILLNLKKEEIALKVCNYLKDN